MKNGSRGRLYIDKDVQRALVVQLIRHWAIFVAMLTGILLALETLSDPQLSFGRHFTALWQRHAPLLIVIVALFPVFVYDSIKLSNRFAGPILRLRGALQEAACGDPARPINFRKGDFWQDIAASYNELVERLNRGLENSDNSPPVRSGKPNAHAAIETAVDVSRNDEREPALVR